MCSKSMIAVQQDRVVRDRIGGDQAVEGRGGAHEPVIPERLLDVECLPRGRMEGGRQKRLHVGAQLSVFGWLAR